MPLEAHLDCPSPSAIVEHGRILLGDEAAQRAGVTGGLGVSVARALLPTLNFLPRDPAREAQALQTLACWAGQFSPRVSLSDATVLIEVGRCLRLFGGLRALVARVGEQAEPLGFTLQLAAAPTPLAAEWLASCAAAVFCADPARLPRHLEALPIRLLPAPAVKLLTGFGARTLGDVRRLPGDRLGRRLGAHPLRLLACAFGELPDPRADFIFPERFDLSLPLPSVVEHAGALLFAARRLTAALSGWLQARQSGVRAATLHLVHESGETPLDLRFADATADAGRFERVLRERLERLTLRAPVDILRLVAEEVSLLAGRDGTLFNDTRAEQGTMAALFERLTARLGEAQVFRLTAQADHRPERATRRLPLQALAPVVSATRLPRPLWLLEIPEPLREVQGRPYRQGPLELLAGPERIESGWWQSGETVDAIGIYGSAAGQAASAFQATPDIRRDYFVALAGDARWLWIFRECRDPGAWFLHGFFA